MNKAVFQPEFSQIALVYVGLLVFGIAFNALIAWSERRKYLEGYVALAVVAGVLCTLAGVALIDFTAALLVLGAFVCSGAPMVAGSIARHVEARRKEQEYVKSSAALAQQRERGEG